MIIYPRAFPNNGLVPIRTHRDNGNGCLCKILYKLNVFARAQRQFLEGPAGADGCFPTTEGTEDRFGALELPHRCREIFYHPTIDPIPDASLEFLKVVVHVKVGEDKPVDGVHGASVTKSDKVEVTAAPRRPVVVPYSFPTLRIYCDSEPGESSANSVGKGPFPTLVEYALKTPRTRSMARGPIPPWAAAPAAHDMPEDTKG